MSNRRYRLKERLKSTEKWIEDFLDVERHRSISKKALKSLNKDKPVLGFIFRIIYLPTRILDFISIIVPPDVPIPPLSLYSTKNCSGPPNWIFSG